MVGEIQEFLGSYFEVLQSQDLSLFDRVFHRDCVLYSQQDGATVVRSLSEYRKIVEERNSPDSGGFARRDEILMIDVLAPDMVLAKVRLRLFNNIMVDYLNLMRVDGRWQIVSKLFYRLDSALTVS